MSTNIFYTIGICCMGGIFLRSFFYVHHSMLILLGIALLCAHLLYRDSKNRVLLFACLALLSIGVGAYRMDSAIHTASVLAPYASSEVRLDARIVREPEMRTSTVHLYVEPLGLGTTHERVLVTVDRFKEISTLVRYGDIISVEGTVQVPEAFTTDGGRIFDYPGYLRVRGVQYTIPYADVERVYKAETGFMQTLFRGKEAFQDVVRSSIPQPAAGLGEGVLLGVRTALGETVEEAFRVTGIIHIVVLSGYNIMIVVKALAYMLSFFLSVRMRMVVGILGITTFVLMVGFSATAIRAGIMASLLLVAQGTGRTYVIVRALLIAAVGMVLINPYLLVHDPGFQLSFLATLGLIVLAPHVERWFGFLPQLLAIRTIVTATVATQIMVLPLLLYQTGLLSVVALVVNALVLPMVPVAMSLTFLTGVFGTVSATLGSLFGFSAYLSLTYILELARLFAAVPFASFAIPAFPFWMTLVAYVGMALWIRWLQSVARQHNDIHDHLKGWTIEDQKSAHGYAFRAPP